MINSIVRDAMQFLESLKKNKMLSKSEILICFEAARNHVIDGAVTVDFEGRKRKVKTTRELIEFEFSWIIAEFTVAKELGLYYDPADFNKFRNRADLGDNIEVRWTPYTAGHLIIELNDRRDDYAVLVTGQDYVIRGYMPIREAMSDVYWKTTNYWIPQSHLSPIDELRMVLSNG